MDGILGQAILTATSGLPHLSCVVITQLTEKYPLKANSECSKSLFLHVFLLFQFQESRFDGEIMRNQKKNHGEVVEITMFAGSLPIFDASTSSKVRILRYIATSEVWWVKTGGFLYMGVPQHG